MLARRFAAELYQHRVIDIGPEGLFNCIQIGFVAVRR
jgi:hypothetical protein